jgi:hypothetical protein
MLFQIRGRLSGDCRIFAGLGLFGGIPECRSIGRPFWRISGPLLFASGLSRIASLPHFTEKRCEKKRQG